MPVISGDNFEMICLQEMSIDLLRKTFEKHPRPSGRGYKRRLDNFKFVSIYYTWYILQKTAEIADFRYIAIFDAVAATDR